MLPGSNFSSFPQYFQYISNFGSQITHSFVKCGCSIYVFLSSANLIYRGTDISKYVRESLGFRDNENRVYLLRHTGCSPPHILPGKQILSSEPSMMYPVSHRNTALPSTSLLWVITTPFFGAFKGGHFLIPTNET